MDSFQIHCQPCSTHFGFRDFVQHVLHDYKSTNSVQILCIPCQLSFSTWAPAWRDHLSAEHGKGAKPIPCAHPGCPETFDRWKALRAHFSVHMPKTIPCKCHNHYFASARKLKSHINQHKKKLASLRGDRKVPPHSRNSFEQHSQNDLEQQCDGPERDADEVRDAAEYPQSSVTTNAGGLKETLTSIHESYCLEDPLRKQDASYRYLESIRNDPAALTQYLLNAHPRAQSSLEPFLDGLRSGRLEPCETADATAWQQHLPQVFRVRDLEPGVDLNNILGMALLNAPQGVTYQRGERSHPTSFKPSYVPYFITGESIETPLTVLNIPLEDTLLRPPSEFEKQYQIYQREDEDSAFKALAHLNMRDSIVELHQDRGYCVITAMDSMQMKLWALYPWKCNKDEFLRSINYNGQFLQCEERLKNGIFVVTMPGDAIYLPPGCLHSTFTLKGGSLWGSVFAVAQGVVPAAEILYADTVTQISTSTLDLEAFLRSLHVAVLAGNVSEWREALGVVCGIEWCQFTPDLNKKKEKTEKQTHLEKLVLNIRLLLRDQLDLPCRHTNCYSRGRIGDHFPFNLGRESSTVSSQYPSVLNNRKRPAHADSEQPIRSTRSSTRERRQRAEASASDSMPPQ